MIGKSKRTACACALALAGGLVPAGVAHGGLLSKATTPPPSQTGNSSGASAVNLGNGAVVVSGAQTSPEGSRWDAVAINGQSLVGTEAKPNQPAEHVGPLAGVKSALDPVNSNPCRDVSDAEVCAGILYSEAQNNHGDASYSSNGYAFGFIAGARIETSDGRSVEVLLLPAGAEHNTFCAGSGADVAYFSVADGEDTRIERVDPSASSNCIRP